MTAKLGVSSTIMMKLALMTSGTKRFRPLLVFCRPTLMTNVLTRQAQSHLDIFLRGSSYD